MKCFTPITLKNPKYEPDKPNLVPKWIVVPCGTCPACRSTYVQDWVTRCLEEMKSNKYRCYFLTLTYNEQNLAHYIESFGNLVKDTDVTLFLKRLRKRLDKKSIKYFYTSEQGEVNGRLHFHMLLFGIRFPTKQDAVKCFETTWKNGFVHVGNVTEKSIKYVINYINKDFDSGQNIHRCSKGFGSSILRLRNFYAANPYERQYYPDHEFKRHLPRYFRNKLYTEAERQNLARFNLQNKKLASDQEGNLSETDYYENLSTAISEQKSFCDRYYRILFKYKNHIK